MSREAVVPTPLSPAEDIVLRVQGLGKRFKLYPSQSGRLKEWLTFGKRSYHNDFWALSDVSFELRRGEFLGVIGPNGAGKSTLLKLITGVLEPSQGSHWASGKVLSLLELSGGMDNDLTGRENVIRSAQLLGFPDDYAKQRMAQIAEFAELNEFFDAPLSVYSSGMRIRLAFSLFAFMDCDILILDEVLAVGDIFFKQKCFVRLQQLIEKQTAIVLVTHSMSTVLRYCKQVMVLDHGQVIFNGKAEEAVQKYTQIKSASGVKISLADTFVEDSEELPPAQDALTDWPSALTPLSDRQRSKLFTDGALLTGLAICDKEGKPCTAFKQGDPAYIYFEYQIQQNMGVPVAELILRTPHNLRILCRNSLKGNHYEPPRALREGDVLRYREKIALDLAPGEYIFSLFLYSLHPEDYDQLDLFSQAELVERLVTVSRARQAGVIHVFDETQGAREIHVGMFNLGGDSRLQVLREELPGLPAHPRAEA